MTSIKDMITDIQSKNAGGVEDKFNSIMADRIQSAIETKYNNMFGSAETEEAEVEDTPDEPVETQSEAEPEELETETEE